MQVPPAAPVVTTSAVAQPDVPICMSQSDSVGMTLVSGLVMPGSSDPRANVQYKIGTQLNSTPFKCYFYQHYFYLFYLDQIPAHRQDIIVVQTPVVSAMSDAPSVEILPTPQKSKSKK